MTENKKQNLCIICLSPITDIVSEDLKEYCPKCIKLMYNTMGWEIEDLDPK